MTTLRAPAPRRGHFLILAAAWTVFAVYGSLVPLHYQPVEWADAVEQFRNLPPLWFGMGSRADWVANILLFIPLSFLWMGALACGRGRSARLLSAAAVVPIAAAAAVALEFTQIHFAVRTVSRNDILAETIGGAIGAALWLGAGERVAAWLRSYGDRRDRRSQLDWILGTYVVGLVVYSVIPLDLTVSITELYHKWKDGRVILLPFSYAYESAATVVYQFFADIVEFIPVGAWAALELGRRTTVLSRFQAGVVAGTLLAIGIEFAQLLVLSRFTDVTDILFAAGGVAIGSRLATRGDGEHAVTASAPPASPFRSAAPWLLALAGYSVFLAAGFWFPFDFSRDRELVSARYQDFFRVPFLALYQGSEFNAIKQALVRLMLFVPVGAIWAFLVQMAAAGPPRVFAGLLAFMYAATLAFGLEAVQILMPSKIADFTEVLLCATGAAAGFLLTRRLLAAEPPPVPLAALPGVAPLDVAATAAAPPLATPVAAVSVPVPAAAAAARAATPALDAAPKAPKSRMLRVVRLPEPGQGSFRTRKPRP